jgi:hypothetical protein
LIFPLLNSRHYNGHNVSSATSGTAFHPLQPANNCLAIENYPAFGPLQALINIPKYRRSIRRSNRIKQRAHLIVTGYLIHPKQALCLAAPLASFHVLLMAQKRMALGKEPRKHPHPGIDHLILSVFARAGMGECCKTLLDPLDQSF